MLFKAVGTLLLGLMLLLPLSLATAQSSEGKITVTAVVESSAMWVQTGEGKWSFVIANAADPPSTFGVQKKVHEASPESEKAPGAPLHPAQVSRRHGTGK